MASKRPTLTDVAKRAGLSATAASLILNGRTDARLSQDAHRRVREAAVELGYRPNIAARSLRTTKTQAIAFISDRVATTRFASGLIHGATEAADEAGHALLMFETGGDEAREARAVEVSLDRQVDGIVFASMRTRDMIVPFVPDDIPVVMLNATSAHHPASVLPDEFKGGRTAAGLLVSRGHGQTTVLLGHDADAERDQFRSAAIDERLAGIHSAIPRFIEELSCWDWDPEPGYEAIRALLARRRDATAILCLNDRLAFGAYEAVREAGFGIPDDIAIVSFDDDEIAAYLRPGLTTVALPHEAMGRRAVELLLGGATTERLLVPMPLVARASL